MATSTGANLAAGKRAIERQMDDNCTIYRNPDGRDDAVLNVDTGQLVADQEEEVYTGRCLISLENVQPNEQSEGGQPGVALRYRLAIPLESPLPVKGDWVRVNSTRRDPSLVDQTFRIRAVTSKTFAISRKCEMVRIS